VGPPARATAKLVWRESPPTPLGPTTSGRENRPVILLGLDRGRLAQIGLLGFPAKPTITLHGSQGNPWEIRWLDQKNQLGCGSYGDTN